MSFRDKIKQLSKTDKLYSSDLMLIAEDLFIFAALVILTADKRKAQGNSILDIEYVLKKGR